MRHSAYKANNRKGRFYDIDIAIPSEEGLRHKKGLVFFAFYRSAESSSDLTFAPHQTPDYGDQTVDFLAGVVEGQLRTHRRFDAETP